jgi:FkbM family methyltransferase
VDLPSVLRAVRHAPLLDRAEPVWRVLRPRYDAALARLYGRRGIELRVGRGERIRVDPACRGYLWEGELREDAVWGAVLDEVRPGTRFADVGANIGVYTVAAARRGALVTSFEPNPATAALLRRTVALNGVGDRVTVREVALASSPGDRMLVSSGGVANVAARLDRGGDVRVRAEILDAAYDVVKIDVEGAELDVLAGAAPVLADPARRPHTIVLELHVAVLRREGADPAAFRELLPGFALERLDERADTGREHWLARAV